MLSSVEVGATDRQYLIAKMKLFILALLPVILAVSSESINTKTVTDQKNDNSAFLQKFLPPLNHNIHQRYGMNYGLNAELIKDILRNDDHKYYDYVDDLDDDDDLRHDGRSRLYNVPNIWGYSRNGGLGKLVSQSYNGDSNVWGYLRNSEGRMSNSKKMGEHNMGQSRHEGRNRNIGPIYLIPRNQAPRNMMGLENMGLGNNMGHGNNIGYGNMGIGNVRLDNMLQNVKALLEPDHIGYVGQVHHRGRGIKERHNFAMVDSKDLDVRRAMAHGRHITHSLLSNRRKHNNMPYYH